MNILVTGGAGYIGAHTVLEFVKSGHTVSVVDDLSTGKTTNVPSGVKLYEGDFADSALLQLIFAEQSIEAVAHIAASIEVDESFENPQKYLENNTVKTAQLIGEMTRAGIQKLLFASSAAVYGNQDIVPISEDANTQPVNPYGETKLLAEQIIFYHCAYSGLKAVALRFFNACGSAQGSNIFSTNTTSLLAQVMINAKNKTPFNMFGDDHVTPDGTCIRDLIHVQDIARAHALVLENLENQVNPFEAYNVGTGKGSSIKEVLDAAERVLGKKIEVKIAPSKPDDVPVSIADTSKIVERLAFTPKFSDLETIIKTSLH